MSYESLIVLASNYVPTVLK